MKKIFQYTLSLSIATSLFFAMSCNKDENDVEDLTLTSINEASKTSGGSCSSAVDFKDLTVETSWISNDKGDRDTFGACGVDDEDWMNRLNSGGVVMRCLSGDGHRTELKEDVGDEAPLDHYRRMSFTGKFTNLPEHGVTIAQIHNRHSSVKRPWIRVYIDDDKKVKIKETETSPNGSSSNYSTYTGPQYSSGDTMTITVWTGTSGQKKGKVKIETNGNTYQKVLWPSSSWDSYKNDYYLKAGVYTEGDDKEVKVKYDSFSIIH